MGLESIVLSLNYNLMPKPGIEPGSSWLQHDVLTIELFELRIMGIEPMSNGWKPLILNHCTISAYIQTRNRIWISSESKRHTTTVLSELFFLSKPRIELGSSLSKRDVLPLNYSDSLYLHLRLAWIEQASSSCATIFYLNYRRWSNRESNSDP